MNRSVINPLKDAKERQLSPRATKGKPEAAKELKREASVVVEERELGLTYLKPEYDKLLCEPL